MVSRGYTASLHGKIDHDTRLTDVRLDVPVENAQFEPAFPKGVRGAIDEGFRRVDLDEAVHAFGYRPWRPLRCPMGSSAPWRLLPQGGLRFLCRA